MTRASGGVRRVRLYELSEVRPVDLLCRVSWYLAGSARCPSDGNRTTLSATIALALIPTRSPVSVTLPRNEHGPGPLQMSSSSNRGMHGTSRTKPADDPMHRLSRIEDLRAQGELPKAASHSFPAPARHFLTWLTCTATATETVDGAVYGAALSWQHDCTWLVRGERPWRQRHPGANAGPPRRS